MLIKGYRGTFNKGWKFMLEEEKIWRDVNIPHDWSIEKGYDKEKGDGATGYLTGGIGSYKKEFIIEEIEDKCVYVLFDGVYNNSETSLNNKKLGKHPYGYSPFYYDMTEHIVNGKNEIEVKVDRTRYVDSRWYTGSGIYRNVEIAVLNKVHIPIWGAFVTTPEITEENARINLKLDIRNTKEKDEEIVVKVATYDDLGRIVEDIQNETLIKRNSIEKIEYEYDLKYPKIWTLENPTLYRCVIKLEKDEEVIDTYEVKFGVREICFKKDGRFLLNGREIKIKGVCLHHDGGLVGAAVPKDVWIRRIGKLKEGGCNAIRIAHNPASNELLEVCDEMGLLVQDEFFDEWDYPKDKRMNMNDSHSDYISRGYTEHFQEWGEKDLKNTILSHRNHPCIFQWSIGNEIEWTYPRNVEATGFFDTNADGNYFWNKPPNSIKEIKEKLNTLSHHKYDIGKTANKLATWTRELDLTRPVIANCILPSVSFESGYTDALDIVGFSYRRVIYDYAKENYPDKICMGTENLPQWHEWKAIEERNHISGTFLWTGIDYMGEAHSLGWPIKGLATGLLDLAGFEKPSYYMYKSLWSKTPSIYIATQSQEKSMFKNTVEGVVEKEKGAWKKLLWMWHDVNKHWNYEEGEATIVEVYSNCKEVELFIDDKSLGKQYLKDLEDHIYKWSVNYKKGRLKAVGLNGRKKVEYVINSSDDINAIDIKVDKKKIKVDSKECAHIEVQLLDFNKNNIYTKEREITFEIKGEIEVLGVDNGDIKNIENHKTNVIKTNQGRAMIILQSKGETGRVLIRATSGELKSDLVAIKID